MYFFLLLFSKAKCTIDNIPDDNLKFESNVNYNTNTPYYYFIFDGDCSDFDYLIQKCKKGIVNYTYCNFVNNAVKSICYKDITYDMKIPIDVEKIFYVTSSETFSIRYSKFRHSMIVHVKATDETDPEKYFQNYNKPVSTTHKLNVDTGIKDKVHYLTVENFNIIGYMETDTVHLINSKTNYRVDCNNLVTENSSFPITNSKYNKYSIVIRNKNPNPQYRIEFSNGGAVILCKDYDEEEYTEFESFSYRTYSYEVVLVSHYIDIRVCEGTSESNILPLNISLMSIDDELSKIEKSELLEGKNKYYVNLTSSGFWNTVRYSKQVYFTADQNYIDLETHLDEKIEFTTQAPYIYYPVTWAPRIYQPLDHNNDTSVVEYIILTTYDKMTSCEYILDNVLRCRFQECNGYGNYIHYILEGKCATETTLNDILKNMPNGIDKVYIDNEVDYATIDLSSLPYQVVVSITSYKEIIPTYDYNSKQMLNSDPNYQIWKTVILNGGGEDKISYLTISNSFLTINGFSLNVHSLKLIHSTFSSDSFYAYCDNLIADFDSHVLLFSNNKFQTKQYGLIVPWVDYDPEDTVYQISVDSDRWSLYYKSVDETEFEPINQYYGYVPYTFADTVNLIIVSHEFTFTVGDSYSYYGKKINITLISDEKFDENSFLYYPPGYSYYPVKFYASDKVTTSIDITFTVYLNLVNLQSTSPYLSVFQDSVYVFYPHQLVFPEQTANPNPTSVPNPTKIPVKPEITIKRDILYKNEQEITDIGQFKVDLEKAFDKLKISDGEGDICVVEVNTIGEIPFSSKLDDDQYMQVQKISTVDFKEGNLNIYVPGGSEPFEVTIKTNSNKDVNLSLIGRGHFILEDESENDEINILKKIDTDDVVAFTVPKNVKSFSIDTVDLTSYDYNSHIKYSYIYCEQKDGDNITITMNNVNAYSYALAELENVVLNGTLRIEQFAHLKLKNFEFKSTKIEYNLYNFLDVPTIIDGDHFSNAPESFDIHVQPNADELSGGITLVQGYFDENVCEEWVKRINLNVEKYDPRCINFNYHSKTLDALYKEIRIYGKNDDDDDNNKNKGLPPGAIAGIVIAVILVVAAVVVAVVIVLKKKKNANNSDSVNEGNEGNQGNQEEV